MYIYIYIYWGVGGGWAGLIFFGFDGKIEETALGCSFYCVRLPAHDVGCGASLNRPNITFPFTADCCALFMSMTLSHIEGNVPIINHA